MIDDDPFGSRPKPRRRWSGLPLLLLGVLVILGGIAATVSGIAGAVGSRSAIEDDAVGRGTVRDLDAEVDRIVFRVPGGERRDFSVYVLFGGVESNSEVQEVAVRDTSCEATLPDGVVTRFRGARQGTSLQLGDAASVGHFSSQPGEVAVRCAYLTSTRSSRRQRPEALPYVVTPGKPSGITGDALLIVAGVLAGIGGGVLTWLGWSRRA